ncbi:hypothetical protein R7036_22915 [Vibrio sp. 1637]|uniref:hypothetical protein n=1 Tax=Vibrio sp. 1637 TaxID=3074569 RepID=UPI0029649DE3|nr:hypothetical protein [Vibrio sp. 1637]MDW2177994.1 hypothetical protein [Vibrio sp. 1637]
MEEALTAVLRALGALLKTAVQLILIEFIGYSVGWVVSKIVTFGRFPSPDATQSDRLKVSYIGLASIVFTLIGIAIFNGA